MQASVIFRSFFARRFHFWGWVVSRR